jgi:hypothetical protein
LCSSCHYKIPIIHHALSCASSLVPCQEVLHLRPLPTLVACSVEIWDDLFLVFHSQDKLICGNWDLVDVMIGLLLVDVGMILLCLSHHRGFASI